MQVGRLTLSCRAVCKRKVLDTLTIGWPHLGPPRDVQLPDQEGNAQAFLEPQEETACVPWFQPSFDMLILQFPRNANHLRLNNLSIYIHTRDLPYPRATLSVLISGLQGSALCIGNDGGAAAAYAWGGKSSGAHDRQRKASPTVNDKPAGRGTTTWSPRLHSPWYKSCPAISRNCSLLPPWLSFVFESPETDSWIIICACRCC